MIEAIIKLPKQY